MAALGIQVWSDIACPWCYVGKRRLEAALAVFPHGDQVSVTWRSFELDSSAPRVQTIERGYAARLAGKYRTSVAAAEQMIETMTVSGAAEGLALRFDRIRPGNTFDAHRVLHMAAARGLGGAAKERLFRAYFSEGQVIGDREVLVRLAGDIGLDGEETAAMLATDAYARDVRADEAEASTRGIHGVPFFLIGRYGVSGAQPVEAFGQVLDRAWHDQPGAEVSPSSE